MNFSKVKLFICLCLLILNIVVGFFCLKINNEKYYISEDELELAQKHLSKNGVEVLFNAKDRKTYSLPVYSLSVNTDYEEKIIPQIFKNLTEAFFDTKLENSAFINTPGGYSVSVKSADGLLMGTASFENFLNFECYYEKSVEHKDIQEIQKSYYEAEFAFSNKNDEKTAEKFIRTALNSYEMKFEKFGIRIYNNGSIVCFTGKLSNVPTMDYFLNVYVKNNKVVCCVGNITDTVPEKAYSAKLIDVVNATYIASDYFISKNFNLKRNKVTVNKITMTYKLYEYSYGSYYAVPAWIISYKESDGSENNVVFDAVTGKNVQEL